MKYILGIIFLTLSGLGFASDSECVISPEKEEEINKILYELGVEGQFSFQGILSELRKDAFNQGSLSLVEKIDDKLLRIAILILHMLDDDKPLIKQKAADAFSRFIDEQQYYPLTWSESELEEIKRKIQNITNQSEKL